MNVLITGAGGFIGRAVVAGAGSRGANVRAHLGPADDPGALPADMPSMCSDITDGRALAAMADDTDVVVHLAGPASVADSFTHPAEHLRVHALGTQAIVDLCRSRPGTRLVYVSSAEVYGRSSDQPVHEDTMPAPRSPYAAAKLAAEHVVGAAVRSGGLDAVIVRPFSVYGPHMRAGSVLGTIVAQAVDGGPVSLHDLRPVRDYCFVDDVADAVWQAAAAPPADGLRVCNVGTGVATSVRDLAVAALQALGREARIDTLSGGGRPPAADIPVLVADVRRARRELAWAATTSLADGLNRTLDSYAVVGRRS